MSCLKVEIAFQSSKARLNSPSQLVQVLDFVESGHIVCKAYVYFLIDTVFIKVRSSDDTFSILVCLWQ
jgi:hypothetical protein